MPLFSSAILCIAWSAIFVRWTSIPGPASAFYRLLIPAIVLLPTWLLPGQRQKLSLRSYAIIAVGGLFFALDLAFYNTSILQTNAANATLLANNTPIVVGLLTWLVFRRRPSCFLLDRIGACRGRLAGHSWAPTFARHAKFGLGDAMALAAAACFAVYLAGHGANSRAHRHSGISSPGHSFQHHFHVSVYADSASAARRSGSPHVLALLGLGLVSQLGGYLALTYALGHLPATVTSVSLLSQGPLTAVLAALLLGEPLTAYQIAGGALVLVGVWLGESAWQAGRRGEPRLSAKPLTRNRLNKLH